METLTLAAETEARRALAGRELALRVLRPAFAAVGVGTLRVLRISEHDGSLEIIAGYDRYERIPSEPRRGGA